MRYILTLTFLMGLSTRAEWPQYRGPNHDGSTIGKISTSWSGKGARMAWKTKTPNGFSSFAVSGGQAFTIFTREGKETLVAFDAKNGREGGHVALNPADYGHSGGNAGARNNNGGDGPRSTPS
ncbi:MAG: alcohol dehydrogenase, partial [Verrucomicrobiota bacterium]|nr:alcohol dehydrogenase [Verrucomicrobiota bacterium]